MTTQQQNLAFIVIGVFCVVAWWFYRPQINNFLNTSVGNLTEFSVDSWNYSARNLKKLPVNLLNSSASVAEFSVSSWNNIAEFSVSSWNYVANNFKKLSFPSFDFNFPSFNFKKVFGINKAQVADNLTKKETAPAVKDCGVSVAPDPKNPRAYGDDAVLTCLGNSVLRCEDAQAVLKDTLFPTIFQIIKDQNACNFKLSYGEDSALTDITGKKLAGQSILCPVGIVKTIDETKKVPLFNAPSRNNPGLYASQIYFYGTLGLFIENNVDQNKIQALGCRGEFISSVIASYRKMQEKI